LFSKALLLVYQIMTPISSTPVSPPLSSAITMATAIVQLPRIMKAAQGKDYGDIDEMLSVVTDVPTPPRMCEMVERNNPKHRMLIRVLTVALAPGDCRVLSGLTRELQGPSSFPYIPGGDCCGIVIDLPTKVDPKHPLPFQVGDRVVARFTEKPMGALGEYAMVSTLVADKVPDSISSVDAAALISASPVIDLIRPVVRGERVLVLGASGGIGAHFCQLLRRKGVSYVVGVSRNTERLLNPPIQCDDAIDYTTTDVFSLEKYRQNKFDTIFDFAGGGYQRLEECVQRNEPLIVQPASMGGRFITTVPLHGPIYEVHSIWAALKIFLFPSLWKAMTSRTFTRSKLPKYSFSLAINDDRTPATKVMEYAENGSLTAVVDERGPFPLTTEGIRHAFRLQESRHAHGKVVIQVASDAS
jgi:NADPH:quinone reductase-like Zn-dependent oxidoreductase